MPPQQGVGCDDRRDVAQPPTTQSVRAHREPAPVVIGQLEPLAPQLAAQEAVLFHQKGERLPLPRASQAASTVSSSWRAEGSITSGRLYHGRRFRAQRSVDPTVGQNEPLT